MLNTNTLHNIINIVITVLAAMAAFDWSVLVSATTAATIISALATLKLVVNALRDGLDGLVKEQPPVK